MLVEALLLWFAERECRWGVVCRTVQEQVRLLGSILTLNYEFFI
jgi:hypothetical protein